MQPSIIFLDEIDALAPVGTGKQDQVHSSVVGTLLALMEAFTGGKVVGIRAISRLKSVDPALWILLDTLYKNSTSTCQTKSDGNGMLPHTKMFKKE
ncbi:ATPase family AAA domain-containing protein 2-like isoform X2 [Cyanistes caeruleus]|uniref:ATPase family AAA domain-containing protein 2-like isoform X2 n=1 Tax=Cyanistes caeruleus TaxID=156563 RepID=UPI000CDAEC78|nr:ATPase family AAA domain-containing protein 2-like isoform X2 [Cyanistes caeruleus]